MADPISSRFRRFSGTLAVVMVAVCACGTSTAGSNDTSPIHIALLTPLTGQWANFGTFMSEGAKVGAAAVNASGGIMGRHLILDIVDTQGDPVDSIPAFQKEEALNHPVAIVGPTDLEMHALQPLFDRIPIVDMYAGGDTSFDTNTDKWVFRINASDSELAVAEGLYANKMGYKTAAMVSSVVAGSQEITDRITKTLQKAGGTMAAVVTVTDGEPSYRSEVQKVLAVHPDVIFVQIAPNTAGTFFNNMREVNNLSIPVIGSDSSVTQDWLTAVTPTVMNKVLTSVVGSSTGGGGTAEFTKFYQQLFNKGPDAATNQYYDPVVALALAMTKAHSTSAADIQANLTLVCNPPGQLVTSYADGLAALNAGKKINYDGASGPLDFNQYQNVFGAFDIVKANPDGTFKTLQTLSAADLLAAAS